MVSNLIIFSTFLKEKLIFVVYSLDDVFARIRIKRIPEDLAERANLVETGDRHDDIAARGDKSPSAQHSRCFSPTQTATQSGSMSLVELKMHMFLIGQPHNIITTHQKRNRLQSHNKASHRGLAGLISS